MRTAAAARERRLTLPAPRLQSTGAFTRAEELDSTLNGIRNAVVASWAQRLCSFFHLIDSLTAETRGTCTS